MDTVGALPSAAPEAALDYAIAQLRSAGFKITAPRRAILRALVAVGEPCTIEAIHSAVGKSDCDQVTVYRCIEALEMAGVARRMFTETGTILVHADWWRERFYAVFRRSVQTSPVSEVPPEIYRNIQAIEHMLRAAGFREVSHVVQFFADLPPGSSK